MVEHSAVNRRVVGSSPTRGANSKIPINIGIFYMEYYLYILKSSVAHKYYTGISKNPQKRLEYHNTIEKGFTSRYRPWEIVMTRKLKNKSEAIATEKKIKKWKSKIRIEKIITGEIKL
jgi:putative endonuclease